MKFRKSENYSDDFIDLEQFCHAENFSAKEHRYALDNALPEIFFEMASNLSYSGRATSVRHGFLGYPMLEEIAQNPLISAGVETLADEMTRKFIKLNYISVKSKHEENQAANKVSVEEKLSKLEVNLKKYEIQKLLRKVAEKIGYYGGCLLFIDTGTPDNLLQTPLLLDSTVFRKNSFKGFRIIDPINCAPGGYNSINPLSKHYFNPQSWLIAGKEVHASRFLYFTGKEAPLLYKPAYNFFGVPLAQLAFEYVVHFTKSRDAAARLLTKFSLTALKTNMSGALAGEGTNSLEARLGYFIEKQNNNGIFALDKEQEDLVKLDTSLSGTTEIVRQSLELIATVFRIPAVKFLGISPSGFNATGLSDIQNFYDYCASLQEKQLSANLRKILQILQLNSFSEIEEGIDFTWLPLGEKEKKTEFEIQEIKSNIIANYLDKNIITKEEARAYLLQDNEELIIKNY